MKEQELASGCVSLQRDAQRELYVEYSRRVYAICSRYMDDDASAQDLMQEVFIKVFASIGKFSWRGEGSLGSWISKVTVNMALDTLRRDSRFRMVAVSETIPCEDEVVEPGKVRGVPVEMIYRMIRELPEGYRTVFNMYCFDGFSHKEIASRLGINEKSSSSQLSRARALLARMINEYLKENE